MTRPPQAPEAIDLTRLAEVMAHLRRFPDQPGEVLARLGVEARAWDGAVAAWSAARDAELLRGATDLTRRFGVAFGRARRRLDAEQPTLASLGRLADPVAAPAPEPAAVHAVPGHAPSASPTLTVAPAPPVEPPAVVRPARRPAPTVQLGAGVVASRLPFAPGEASAGRTFEAAMAHANAVQGRAPAVVGLGETVGLSRPARSVVGLGETVGIPPGVAEAPRVPPGVPDLTLPQYASLRVELQTNPGEADAILGRYGVKRGGRAELDAYWRARFEVDPLLRMMFAKAFATYTSWLRENRPKS